MQANPLSVLPQVKDSAIFLGCLYFIVFILLLPEFAVRQGIVNGLQIIVFGAVSVLIVHLFLNWTYVVVVAAPLTMTVIFFALGCTIWLFAPGILFPIEGILHFVASIFGGSVNLVLLNDFVTRIGQFLMILSSGLWWVVNKSQGLNHKALVAYIALVLLFGILIGATSFTRLAGVLMVWLVVYSKVKGNEGVPDLTVLFKVAATVAIVFGVFSAEIVQLGKGYLGTQFALLPGADSQAPAGLNAFISLYKMTIGCLILTGVWRPGMILSRLPYREKINEMFGKLMQSAFVKV